MATNVRVRAVRDVVTIGQFWRNRKTNECIWISQVYRHERRVMAIFFNVFGSQTKKDYVSFGELMRGYNLQGPGTKPNAT